MTGASRKMSNYDYASVKIGTVFRGLTLKEKGQPIGLRGKLLPSKSAQPAENARLINWLGE